MVHQLRKQNHTNFKAATGIPTMSIKTDNDMFALNQAGSTVSTTKDNFTVINH